MPPVGRRFLRFLTMFLEVFKVKKMMIFLHKNAINIDAINVSHISCGWFGKCVMSNTNIDSAPLTIINVCQSETTGSTECRLCRLTKLGIR